MPQRSWILASFFFLFAILRYLPFSAISAFGARVRLKDRLLPEPVTESADPERNSRVTDAREALLRQDARAKWYNRAATALTFSQYIVGGVLATSFVQESLSQQAVGFLGLLVLASSLVRQHSRPDLQMRAARERTKRLRDLIRQGEDDLYAMSQGKLDSDAIHGIRAKISLGLSEVEQSELEDLAERSRQDKAT